MISWAAAPHIKLTIIFKRSPACWHLCNGITSTIWGFHAPCAKWASCVLSRARAQVRAGGRARNARVFLEFRDVACRLAQMHGFDSKWRERSWCNYCLTTKPLPYILDPFQSGFLNFQIPHVNALEIGKPSGRVDRSLTNIYDGSWIRFPSASRETNGETHRFVYYLVTITWHWSHCILGVTVIIIFYDTFALAGIKIKETVEYCYDSCLSVAKNNLHSYLNYATTIALLFVICTNIFYQFNY